MATQNRKPQVNGVSQKKPSTPKTAARRPNAIATKQTNNGPTKDAQQKRHLLQNKAASVAGERPASGGGPSAYAIMASRIANRVAEMAESITFVERPKAQEAQPEPDEKRRPRKLEMRLDGGSADAIAFSAPFLDNTLQKMLQLQNRMLKSTAELAKAEGLDEKALKEHAAQSAELSRIIAMICAEKARQGA